MSFGDVCIFTESLLSESCRFNCLNRKGDEVGILPHQNIPCEIGVSHGNWQLQPVPNQYKRCPVIRMIKVTREVFDQMFLGNL